MLLARPEYTIQMLNSLFQINWTHPLPQKLGFFINFSLVNEKLVGTGFLAPDARALKNAIEPILWGGCLIFQR
ncbi:hypothetical protein QUB68_05820 [Microcoleus sp. A006_D1]